MHNHPVRRTHGVPPTLICAGVTYWLFRSRRDSLRHLPGSSNLSTSPIITIASPPSNTTTELFPTCLDLDRGVLLSIVGRIDGRSTIVPDFNRIIHWDLIATNRPPATQHYYIQTDARRGERHALSKNLRLRFPLGSRRASSPPPQPRERVDIHCPTPPERAGSLTDPLASDTLVLCLATCVKRKGTITEIQKQKTHH